MEHRVDSPLFQEPDQAVAFFICWKYQVKHVGIIPAAFRNKWEGEEAFVFQVFQFTVIIIPDGKSFFVDFIGFLELGIEKGCCQLRRKIG